MKNLLLLLFTLFFLSSSQAQSVIYDYGYQNHVRLELNKPIFKEDGLGFESLTVGAFLNGHFKVGQTNTLAVELPISRGGIDGFAGLDSDIGLGNIGLAFQLRNTKNANFLEFALRGPIASDDNIGTSLGQLFDYSERFPAFVPNFAILRVSYVLQSKAVSKGYFRAKPGLTILIPAGDDEFDQLETEALFNVNVAGGYRTNAIDVNGGFTAITILTEKDLDFSERLAGMLFASFTYTKGNFQPGVVLRLPMDDNFSDFYSITAGISLNYIIGRTIDTEN